MKIVVKELQRMTVARVIPYNGLGMLEFGTTDSEGVPICGTVVAMIRKDIAFVVTMGEIRGQAGVYEPSQTRWEPLLNKRLAS